MTSLLFLQFFKIFIRRNQTRVSCFRPLNSKKVELSWFFFVLSEQEFEELDRESVELIVCRDDLRIRNEVEVLMALLRWSVFECHRRHLDTDLTNQRLVLDDLIWQVKPFTIQFFFLR